MNKYPLMHRQVATRIVDGTAVIVLADSGEVTVLNPVGTRVWELIDGVHSVQDIVDCIVSEYDDVGPEQALNDVQAFLKSLVDADAIVFEDRPTN